MIIWLIAFKDIESTDYTVRRMSLLKPRNITSRLCINEHLWDFVSLNILSNFSGTFLNVKTTSEDYEDLRLPKIKLITFDKSKQMGGF